MFWIVLVETSLYTTYKYYNICIKAAYQYLHNSHNYTAFVE